MPQNKKTIERKIYHSEVTGVVKLCLTPESDHTQSKGSYVNESGISFNKYPQRLCFIIFSMFSFCFCSVSAAVAFWVNGKLAVVPLW